MKAGASSRDITPPNPEELGTPVGSSTGVHDPLFLRALVLDDGENTVAIVCFDLVGASIEFCDGMREQIRKRTGIPHTLMNFSHTHSAPGADLPRDDNEPHVNTWLEKLNQSVLEAVEEAYAHRTSVSLHAGRVPAQVGFNRRLADENGLVQMQVNKKGAVVPWVNLLEARTADGKTLAVLFEHAAHPVIVHNTSSLIGTDYPGYAVQRINEALGEDVTAMFAQGCSGNINGYPLRGGWKQAEEVGRKLGDVVIGALRETTEIKAEKLNVQSRRIMLPRELPSMEVWHEARDRIRILEREFYRIKRKQLEIMKDKIERGDAPELPLEMNAVMLGSEWCLVTLQHELFCEYELWVDENAPFNHTMVFGYTNGPGAYVPTDKDLALGEKGGYEAGSFPCFWSHAVRSSVYASLVVGIEGMIK